MKSDLKQQVNTWDEQQKSPKGDTKGLKRLDAILIYLLGFVSGIAFMALLIK
jgi:hypothetical protein